MLKIKEIGNLKFYCRDFDRELTICDYLKELLLILWEEQESFSGKRPFGNSGWYYDLAIPLIKNNIIEGKLDEDDYVDEIDDEKFNEMVIQIIKSLEVKE